MPDYRVPVTVTFDLDVHVDENRYHPEEVAQVRAKAITREVFKESFGRAVCVNPTAGHPRPL